MAQQTRTYDVVVLGAGAVGENAADRAGRTGLSVVVVEAELVGGECSYWACMPSKALLRPGAVLAAARGVGGAAQAVTGGVDPAAVLARRDAFASHWDDGSQVAWLAGAGIDLVRGHARLVGPRRVEVATGDGALTLVARHAVVVATGSEPVLPDLPGLAQAVPWTSREATAVHDVPGSLVILGGGVVGVEMATAYADLGAAVTLLVRGDRVLTAAEPFAGRAVGEALVGLGVDVRYGARPTGVTRDTDGVVVELARVGDAAGERVRADELLVATGRRPATGDLGLATVGLEPGSALVVDDALQVTGVDGGWLFAVGDVTGRTTTTHQGKYDARVVGDVVAARFGPGGSGAPDGAAPWSATTATADHAAVPQVVFTRPEVAWVGLTEAAALVAGHPVRTVQVALRSAAGAALAGDDVDGTVQLVVDTEREVLLGATFVGPEVAEMLHAATIAVVGQVPIARLWHAVPAYPTTSEVWLRLLEAYGR
ncbi:NAD(P)/FAD-dependent oxidoreductase [Actinotalea sp.]|uniref:dihydrolipoyl dehydrogenase family protein n=1 Tax=Actinotalea sp. TaxID=1872145 RepID=UPI002BB19844|nr:NAD(P)/FAD-dependent oxidoreductase [Actinotalea sp.]HQY34545.1 NAD(P)/FAD-dependent oxidoreductase [Actinotalea sp.]HRA49412.1 NAD(P)/FAD-dependent oxidoreductase [Actinotalea sp.]